MQDLNIINAILVDDEPGNLVLLSYLLKTHFPDVIVCAECNTVKQAIEAVNVHKPDVVFLDIELHGENGFSLLEKLENINFEVIFVTAYDQYAVKAIKFNALDYLLKPTNKQDLEIAIKKVRNNRAKKSDFSALNMLSATLKKAQNPFEKLTIPVINGYQFVEVENIIYCESDVNYTIFHLINNFKITSSKTLKEYEESLDDFNFVRIHKSYLINIKHIKEYHKGDGGSVIMSNSMEIPVSKTKKDQLFSKLSNK